MYIGIFLKEIVMGNLIKAVIFPIWILSIFSKSKSFGKNPVIKNPVLNLIGLHVFRLLLAHTMSGLRFLVLSNLMTKKERQTFHRDGYLILKNFLPADNFTALEQEAKNYQGEAAEIVQGDTATDRVWLSPEKCDELISCKRLLNSSSYTNRLKYCAATMSSPIFYIQAIRHHFRLGGPDPQKKLHADTFHPTMKAWLYLVDVTPENGPFMYISGSNRLTWKRIKWEYKKSLSTSRLGGGGSFRVDDEDLLELGYARPRVVVVPRNTLVIVNTFGLHCRGEAKEARIRLEIWAYSRVNPFLPLPGLSLKFIDLIRNKIIAWSLRREENSGKVKMIQANWRTEFMSDHE